MIEDIIDKINFKIDSIINEIDKVKSDNNNVYITQKYIYKLEEQVKLLIKLTKDVKGLSFFIKKIKLKQKIKFLNTKIIVLRDNKNTINNKCLTLLRDDLPLNLRKVNNKLLDNEQLNSILVDEDNVLVIAGAGSGKTTTITGKIKYLLEKQKVNPKDILLLTYTNAATEEMKSRVYNETGVNLDVLTFHRLGKKIITKVEDKVPILTNINLNKFIRDSIRDLIKNDDNYKINLIDYLFFHQYLCKTKFDFDTIDKYEEYIKINPLITLKNEKVKSLEELAIANFLTLNSIEYNYEKKYIVDTRTSKYAQYYPDFYLPKYDLWLEHFAINRNGDVPNFFKSENNQSPKDVYNDKIKWKRNLHKEHGTKLIETFSYENKEGILLSNLKSKLEKKRVVFKSIDYDKILNDFMNENSSVNNALTELFCNIINLSKMTRTSIELFKDIKMTFNDSKLRDLVNPIFINYEKLLNELNEIDFSDMLNNAINYINCRKYISDYKYVIVDEFQDMSKILYELLIALRESNHYKLYAVGDDWQSIYRFAGSDIDYIINFDTYFSQSEKFFISNTYRYSQKIADTAGKFIMKNSNQVKKNIQSSNKNNLFTVGKIEGYTTEFMIEFLEKELNNLPKKSDVLFISRYNNDYKCLNSSFEVKYDSAIKCLKVNYLKRLDLNIVFRSIHSSKGLEADYVFILNNNAGNYGFPSAIQDNSILKYFFTEKDDYPFSEERRLMYVALTRALKKVWLVTNKNSQSIFVDELFSQLPEEVQKFYFTCPRCRSKLVKRVGKYGSFYGCTNYPKCKYTKKIDEF